MDTLKDKNRTAYFQKIKQSASKYYNKIIKKINKISHKKCRLRFFPWLINFTKDTDFVKDVIIMILIRLRKDGFKVYRSMSAFLMADALVIEWGFGI